VKLNPIAVELDFMNPLIARGWLPNGGGKGRFDEAGKFAPHTRRRAGTHKPLLQIKTLADDQLIRRVATVSDVGKDGHP